MSAMTPAHQMFLQAFMARGLLNSKEVKDLFRKSLELNDVQVPESEEERKRQLVKFIRTISDHVSPFHLDIRKGVSEDDGTNFYCLVNNVENHITKMASDYSSSELDFFKKLVEQIVENDGAIGSTAALNIVTQDKKLTKNDAQDLLLRLENDRWIMQKEGKVSLSIRSILELDQYIQDVYPDSVKKCNVCKQICLKGQMCEDCGVKIHIHCAIRFFHRQENPRCPDQDCGAQWTHPVPSPSKSHIATSEARQAASQSSERPERQTRKRRLDA
ncbi:hypothetical protein BaRGS_00007567 [Batillaria attramentaria]|uniref:Non-structural maintenance of chromosomes element 1 homolog n=1 Tax=Batillaria attramentaria TaxID=370345 RepID=A0ABD0LP22_9CAEN